MSTVFIEQGWQYGQRRVNQREQNRKFNPTCTNKNKKKHNGADYFRISFIRNSIFIVRNYLIEIFGAE